MHSTGKSASGGANVSENNSTPQPIKKMSVSTSTDDLNGGESTNQMKLAREIEPSDEKTKEDLESIVRKTVNQMSNQQNDKQIGSSTANEEASNTVTREMLAEILSRVTIEAIQRAELAAQAIPKEFVQTNAKIDLVTKMDDVLPICHIEGDNRPYIKVKANGVLSYPLLDCGAMITLLSYVDKEELKQYNTRIDPCSMTITTVNQEDKQVTGVMWLEYKVGGRTALVPTVVMKSHSSYFIAGMDFWRAFEIKLNWNDEENSSSVVPWNEGYRPDYAPLSKAEVKVVHQKRSRKKKSKTEATPETLISGVGMISVAATRSMTSIAKSKQFTAAMQSRDETGCARVVAEPDNEIRQPASKPTPRASIGGVGMISVAAKKSMASIVKNKQQTTAMQSRYEVCCAEAVDKPGNEIWQPASETSMHTTLIRSLLKGMPKRACQVQEVAIKPAIRTASGDNDSYEDVRREKHACVTEPHELTAEQKQQLEEVLKEFPYTPESGPLNCTPLYQQEINTADAKPIMKKQYPMSPYVMAEVEEELQRLIEKDIIEPIDYSAWRWPILWVRKKSGGGRICLDARGLNKITVRDAYPTLKVETILQNLPSARFVSCLDMTQAFHQISIRPEDRRKTAFAVGHRFFCFKRATMGFTNSPADLAKVLDRVFGDMVPHVYHYVDDFIIVSATFEEHIELLRKVARRMREAQLSISRKKSMFCYRKITFLGYIFEGGGLSINPERVQPIIDYKRPETVKELRRLIGLVGWYRRFIPNAAGIMAPLTELTKGKVGKSARIEWNNEAEKAFEEVKQALTSSKMLAVPDYSLPFKIYTDASLLAGAAVLTQIHGGEERIIAYHSAKFTSTQQNYSATERECLAVLTGVEKFRPFIDGVRFTVVTDHHSLKWLQNMENPHGKLARWACRLQAFDIAFEHRPGTQMVVPDALSRSVDLIDIEKETKTEDRWYNEMVKYAKSGKAHRYKWVDGRLYHLGRFDVTVGEKKWALCVPKERVRETMAEQHDDAHFGFWKTYRMIQRLYYWPNMNLDIKEYVQKCVTCKLIKPTNENTTVPTGDYLDPKTVGRVLSIDLVGPLPASKYRKHMWIIVVVDVFSKYTFVKACTRATSGAIIEFLEKGVFFRFDTPETVMTDNGAQFRSQLFENFLLIRGIKHFLTPVYHPQSNSVEATNKSVKTLLRAELIKRAQHTDWSEVLDKVVMELNSAPRMPTGRSPHSIVFGKERSRNGREHKLIHDENAAVENNGTEEERREMMYEAVAEQERASFTKNRNQYDLRATVRKFKHGDVVYMANNKQSSASNQYAQKLAPLRKMGIVKELARGSNDIYVIIDQNGKAMGHYHAKQLTTQ